MGFSIYIGNGEMRPVEHPTKYSRVIRDQTIYYDVVVEEVKLADAPAFAGDARSDNRNSRHPSYCDWSRFCRNAGLTDLFFDDKHGLMREHPGFQSLSIDHAVSIQHALSDWKSWHHAVPGFGDGQDHILARLMWLDWWVQWALTHCEHAGIHNR